MTPNMQSKFNIAQRRVRRRCSMASLISSHAQLEIEGKVPKVAIIDTGASSMILGKSFAKQLYKCALQYLAQGDTFVTSGGKVEKTSGRKKCLLHFVL